MPSTVATSSASSVVTSPEPAADATTTLGGRYWRFVLCDLTTGAPISILDRQVRDRSISYERNKGTVITGTISADNQAVNGIAWDGFPNLAEGDRLLYCFRRDYSGVDCDGDPTGFPWTPRASGVLLQYDDAARSEDGITTFTAFDPWQYLYTIPVLAPNSSAPRLHNSDVRYDQNLDEIIVDLLDVAEQWYNQTWSPDTGPRRMFLDWGWSSCYNGTIDIVPQPLNSLGEQVPIFFQKGTSIGQAFDQLLELYDFTIEMKPIYDPVNRPSILCELSVINQVPTQLPGAIFAWDYAPWSVVEISRLVDGTGRRNKINLHATQGGPSVGIITELASVNRFGEYWDETWIIDQENTESVQVMAQILIDTISEHPRTVTITPLPERSPEPFIDWQIGDEVIVMATSNLRATMAGFQRVQAFTLDISDEALEQVTGMRVYIPGTDPSQ